MIVKQMPFKIAGKCIDKMYLKNGTIKQKYIPLLLKGVFYMLEHQISTENMALLKQCQQNEIDEYYIYQTIASSLKNEKDRTTTC